MKLFGFTFLEKTPNWQSDADGIKKDSISFIEKDSESTASVVSTSFSSGIYLDLLGNIKAEADLVTKYREVASFPEVDNAVDEVVNECITTEDDFTVKIDLSKAEMLDDNAKLVLEGEHNSILDLLDYNSKAYWIFRRWYVDGRLYYHAVTDPKHLEEGIKELRYIDPRKMREIREVSPKKITGSVDVNQQAQVMQTTADYYLYNEKGFGAKSPYMTGGGAGLTTSGIRITKDSVVHVPSGISDPNGTLGISHLQKCVKILSQLKTMEDALIIYRLSRAPERRVWYVDVGNLPKQKADQYVRKVMTDQKNKLIYNSSTGEIQDTRKFLTMTEDYWLPKRCLSLDSKIKLLDGRNISLSDIIKEYEEGKENWTLSINKDGVFEPSKIKWAGITKKNTQVMKITLDNDEHVIVTPEHRFIMRDSSEKEAQDLEVGDSVMPCYSKQATLGPKYAPDYEYIHNNTGRDGWIPLHKLVSNYFNPDRNTTDVIHHKDFNRFNNNPDNLVLMDKQDHLMLHANSGRSSWTNGKVEEHKNNLSIAGKAFFQTDEGRKRKEELKLLHATNEHCITNREAFAGNVKAKKENDAHALSLEDFKKKWGYHKPINPSGNHNPWNIQSAKENNKIFDNNFDEISIIINDLREYNLSTIVQQINNRINITFLNINNITKHLKRNGYKNVSDLLLKKYNHIHTRKTKLNYNNKVKFIEWLSETIDTGDIEVDNENHNFTLSIGIVVHNSDGSGTRVDTMPGGQNLGQMDDILYFQKLLYNSLNVPIERMQSDSPFQIGQGDQITRAEIKFDKFCNRLKQSFSLLFKESLKKQVVLKGLMSIEEFQMLERLITYDFAKDSHFAELKDQQILLMRSNAFAQMEQAGIIGRIYSMKSIRREIFQQSDDDILHQTMEIIEDMQNPIYNTMNPASPQGQAAVAQGGQEEDQGPEEQQDDPGDSETPEGSKTDHEQKLQRAKTVIAAIKSIPVKKRTSGDTKKLRSAAVMVGKNPKHSADTK